MPINVPNQAEGKSGALNAPVGDGLHRLVPVHPEYEWEKYAVIIQFKRKLIIKRNIKQPQKKYEVEVFNVVLDRAISELANRFEDYGALYSDFECFDTQRFKQITKNRLPLDSLKTISYHLNLSTEETEHLKRELLSLAEFWLTIKEKHFQDEYLLEMICCCYHR